jgi:hypothetical protein
MYLPNLCEKKKNLVLNWRANSYFLAMESIHTSVKSKAVPWQFSEHDIPEMSRIYELIQTGLSGP